MIPQSVVVDASVLIAAVTARETGHLLARRFVGACTARALPIFVPVIALAEFSGGLSRTGRSAEQIKRFLAIYRSQAEFTVVPIEVELGDEAVSIATLQRIKGCDAIYLALARDLTLPLVTLDREQQDRAPADVEVRTPEQALAKWWPS